MRILISGFEPFLDEKVNPTAAMAEFANSCAFHKVAPELSKLDVRGVVLPVVFDQAFQRLERERGHFSPDVILSFGLAGGRQTFDIEMLAVNERGGEQSAKGDNQGNVFRGLIRPDAPRVLPTTLPVERIEKCFSASDVPHRRSFSAGTYVCNDLFFQMQERLRFTRVRSGFIHVPRMVAKKRSTDNGQTQLEWSVFEAATLAVLRSFV